MIKIKEVRLEKDRKRTFFIIFVLFALCLFVIIPSNAVNLYDNPTVIRGHIAWIEENSVISGQYYTEFWFAVTEVVQPGKDTYHPDLLTGGELRLIVTSSNSPFPYQFNDCLEISGTFEANLLIAVDQVNVDNAYIQPISCSGGDGGDGSSPPPNPVIYSDVSSLSMNVGDEKTIKITVKNNGGPAVGECDVADITISPGLEFVSWMGNDPSLDLRIWPIGTTLDHVDGYSFSSYNAILRAWQANYNAAESDEITFKIRAKSTGNQFVKYRLFFNTDTLPRIIVPSISQYKDQQGGYVYQIPVTVGSGPIDTGEVFINTVRVTSVSDGTTLLLMDKDDETAEVTVESGKNIRIAATCYNLFRDQSVSSWDATLGIYDTSTGTAVSTPLNVPAQAGESNSVIYSYTAAMTREFGIRVNVNEKPDVKDVKKVKIIVSDSEPTANDSDYTIVRGKVIEYGPYEINSVIGDMKHVKFWYKLRISDVIQKGKATNVAVGQDIIVDYDAEITDCSQIACFIAPFDRCPDCSYVCVEMKGLYSSGSPSQFKCDPYSDSKSYTRYPAPWEFECSEDTSLLPDLTVTGLTELPTCTDPGKSITFKSTIENVGGVAASSFNIRSYLSMDTILGSGDIDLGVRTVTSLGAGSSYSESVTTTIPSSIPTGSYYLLVKADSDNVISESNEGNNVKVGPKIQIPCSIPPSSDCINLRPEPLDLDIDLPYLKIFDITITPLYGEVFDITVTPVYGKTPLEAKINIKNKKATYYNLVIYYPDGSKEGVENARGNQILDCLILPKKTWYGPGEITRTFTYTEKDSAVVIMADRDCEAARYVNTLDALIVLLQNPGSKNKLGDTGNMIALAANFYDILADETGLDISNDNIYNDPIGFLSLMGEIITSPRIQILLYDTIHQMWPELTLRSYSEVLESVQVVNLWKTVVDYAPVLYDTWLAPVYGGGKVQVYESTNCNGVPSFNLGTPSPTPQVPERHDAMLLLDSNPTGANLYIDGVYKGTTPVALTDVSSGIHKIRVTKPGHPEYVTELSMPVGKATINTIQLESGSSITVPTTVPTTIPTTAPTQAPSGATGTLSVTSTPRGAMVYVDGVYKGVTPVTIPGVSSGSHQLKVTKSGYQDYSTAVNIPTGRTASIPIMLKVGSSTTIPTTVPTTIPTTAPTQGPSGATGTLSVTSTPTGAMVYVDGVYKGITPVTIPKVSSGSHQLKVTKSGFQDYSTAVNIPAGKTASVPIMLKVGSSTTIPTTVPTTVPTTAPTQAPSGATGTLSVTSTPTGAMVYLDGIYKGITPVTIPKVSSGSHQLKVTKSGYQDYSTSISVPTGKTATIPVNLKAGSTINPTTIPTTIPTIVQYTFATAWGTKGSGDGQFFSPGNIAIDNQGNLIVIDRFNYRIQKFDSSGNFLIKWGSMGEGDGQFGENGLGDLAIDQTGNVYVIDSRKECIQKFDSSGRFLTKWGSEGNEDEQLHTIYSIAINSAGIVYIADWGGSDIATIKMYDSSGNFIGKLGSRGPDSSQFYYPYSIAIDTIGNVYVSDCAKHKIQKFDSSGNYITRWDSAGSGSTCMASILATDPAGNIFESDPNGNRIRMFDPSGKLITSWGSFGSGNGQFDWPWGIAVDKSRNVYIADQGNNRIQKFNPSP